ncbi:ATP-binding cassette domain-containing protein [Polyangium sorediatum]|uniref:ABC transporter ATP-binding protein n=1 Tax=Polyangium sorediatum TaxID=889274 RepID=A0ABT6NNG3_9BACT|nr:ABC transporter ATP-binding protein [Polyangium sorediatum]MDI1429865.1 ABC transporter ATP-binding protein [Polyangium sorediatum]
MRDLWRILRVVRRSLRGGPLVGFVLAVGLASLAGVMAGVLPGLVGVAIGAIQGRPASPSPGLAGLFARLVSGQSPWLVIAATLVAVTISVGVTMAQSRAGSELSAELTAALRVELVRAALWASPRAVDAAGARALAPKGGPPAPPGVKAPAVRGFEAVKLVIARDAAAVSDFAVAVITGLPQAIVTLLVLAFELATGGAWPVLVGTALLFVLSRVLSDRASRRVGERMQSMQRSDTAVFGALGEMLAGTEELRLLGARQTALTEVTDAAHRAADARRSFAAALAASGQIKSVLAAMSPLVLLVALRLSGRTYEAGDIAKLLLVTPLLLARFEALDGLRAGLLERAPLLASLRDLLSLPPHPPEPESPLPLAAITNDEVVLDHVGYRPEGAQDDVLHDVSLRIPAGAVVAICGASGSGKSTLVRLLLRLDDPTRGKIEVGGVDLTRLSPRDLSRLFAVLGQASVLFERSVAENLALGLADPPDEAAMRRLLARVRLDDLAEDKGGRGLGAVVRKVPPNFSGGEQRRLLLARMLLRDARLLVLDEPEAGLPGATAEELLRSVVELSAGRTTILVTHAPHLVKSTFNVVLDKGRIAAMGTHEELVQSSETYRALLSEGQRKQAAPRPHSLP